MPETGTTATAAVPVANPAAVASKASGALLALVRLLARQAAADATRSDLIPAHQEGRIT
jgi:hypothetical protein